MVEHSKTRAQAEAAFLRTQTRSTERKHALSEVESLNQARNAKTARLKEQRLLKEAQERASAMVAPPSSEAAGPGTSRKKRIISREAAAGGST